jgi:hypothetical protein
MVKATYFRKLFCTLFFPTGPYRSYASDIGPHRCGPGTTPVPAYAYTLPIGTRRKGKVESQMLGSHTSMRKYFAIQLLILAISP